VVAAVNAGFRPSANQLNLVRRVLAAADQSGGGAVAVDGKMVDRPVLARARALLDATGPDESLSKRGIACRDGLLPQKW